MKFTVLFFCLFSLSLVSYAQESDELLDLLYKTYHENDDSVKYYFEESKKLINSPEDTILYYFFKAIYFHNEREVDSTLHYGHALVNHPVGQADHHKAMYMYRYMARRLQDRGLYDEAHKYTMIGLEFAEKKGDINDIAYQLIHISNNYHDFEDYAIGVEYGKRAFHMLEDYEHGNPLYKAYALNCIAINFDDWNMPDSALFYHYKVFDYIHLFDSANVQFTFNNIANTLLKNERFAESLPYLLTALKLNMRTKSNRSYNLTTNYTNLGTIAHKTGDYQSAKHYFDSAHFYAQKTQNVEKWRDLYYQDYQFNKTIGNYKKALDMQDKYVELRDSIFNTGRAATLSEMETKYRTALKDQQIAEQELELLNKQSDLQKTIFITSLLILIVLALVTILA
jgi:tetratricopeptide (TPR) repeat protein